MGREGGGERREKGEGGRGLREGEVEGRRGQ